MTDQGASVGVLTERLQALSLTPERGLPEELFLFVSQITPLVNVDLLIKDPQRGVLLTWREDEYHGAGWHVPGGIVRFKESFSDRIHAVAKTELGAKVKHDAEPMVINQIIRPQLDVRGHFISMLFRCQLVSALRPEHAADKKPREGAWEWHESCPENLIPVHEIYRNYF